MFAIGEFARLGTISVRKLRHYDEIGLPAPPRVDPVTGYRSYAIAQLRDLNRIVALRGLGFSLAEVRLLLAGITSAELQGMLPSGEPNLSAGWRQTDRAWPASRRASGLSKGKMKWLTTLS